MVERDGDWLALEPLLHFVIPFTGLLLLGLDVKQALLIGLLGLVPDLDALFHVHRSWSHSFLAYLPLLLVSWFFLRRLWVESVLGYFVLVSHCLMDLFTGYTPVLWPLSTRSYWLVFGLEGSLDSGIGVWPVFDVLSKPVDFTYFERITYSLFTGEGLMVSLILLAPVIIKVLGWRVPQ